MSFFEKLNLRNPHRLQLRRIRARDTACYLILPAKSFAANATRMTGRGELVVQSAATSVSAGCLWRFSITEFRVRE